MLRGANINSPSDDFGELGRDDSRPRRMNGDNTSGSVRGKRDEEGELRKAIEESKKSLLVEQQAAEERELQEALRLSQEEEESRKTAVADLNAAALFDDHQQLLASSSYYPFFIELMLLVYAGQHRRTITAITHSHF